MKIIHTLVSKYVFITSEQYYKYGKIIETVDDEFFLVEILSGNSNIKSSGLYCIGQMIEDDINHVTGWLFFNNRRELNKYLKYIKTSTENSENKVLELVRK